MQAASIALAVTGGCALAAAVAIELATGDPPAGANCGEAALGGTFRLDCRPGRTTVTGQLPVPAQGS
jgi:hypothetical protein